MKKSASPKLAVETDTLVGTLDYRCMAYRNAKGRWVNFYTGRVLADAVKPVY